eukprot:225778-Chlamydomonas_euryale.AAC.2
MPAGRILHLFSHASVARIVGSLPAAAAAADRAAAESEPALAHIPCPVGLRPNGTELASARVAALQRPHALVEVPDAGVYTRIKLCRTMIMDHLIPSYFTAMASVAAQLREQLNAHDAANDLCAGLDGALGSGALGLARRVSGSVDGGGATAALLSPRAVLRGHDGTEGAHRRSASGAAAAPSRTAAAAAVAPPLLEAQSARSSRLGSPLRERVEGSVQGGAYAGGRTAATARQRAGAIIGPDGYLI